MRRLAATILLTIIALPGAAQAGMPTFTVSDVPRVVTLSNMTRERLQAISFFLVGFLLCAWVIQRIWNSLKSDFPILPRLSFAKAAGVVCLWGLLFLLVLTMISGARELMTPGAWRKKGLTYELAADPPGQPAWSPPVGPDLNAERQKSMQRLRIELWRYADRFENEGRFPANDKLDRLPEWLWTVPGGSGERYIYKYKASRRADQGGEPLVMEPESFGPTRLVLLTNGDVVTFEQWQKNSRTDKTSRRS